MSRFSDYEEWDGPDTSGLWWSSFHRAINSDRGQKMLREIEAALLAMPERTLIADVLSDASGGVCAVGAVAAHRRVKAGQSWEDAVLSLPMIEDGDETAYFAQTALGMARTIAWEIAQENDRELWDWNVAQELPQARYERVLAWVQSRIKTVEVPA